MLYDLIEFQRAGLKTLVSWLRFVGYGGLGMVPAGAVGEWLHRTFGAGELGERGIEDAVRLSLGRPVEAEVVATTPFVRLVRLTGRGHAAAATNLVIAPHSGYASGVLHRVVGAMLEVGDVIVTDWIDARYVPLAAGPFGTAEQTAVALAALRSAGPSAAVVAISQSGVAAVRAVMLAGSAAPRTLCLMGCPIDPTVGMTPLQQAVRLLPERAMLANLLLQVPHGLAGAERRVFAGFVQLLALAATSPALYAEVQSGLLLQLLGLGYADYGQAHTDLHALLDVPGELFLDLVDHFRCPDAPSVARSLGLGGPPSNRPPIRLMTVEAGLDALVAAQQTHRAGALIGQAVVQHVRLDLPAGQHPDLFVGSIFERDVRPALQRFLAMARANGQASPLR